MTDGIIIVILVVVLFIGLRSTVKHFTKKGGCCGSSDYKPKRMLKIKGDNSQKELKKDCNNYILCYNINRKGNRHRVVDRV